MTSPSDREVFLNEVREAIWDELESQCDQVAMGPYVDRETGTIDTTGGGSVDMTALAAVDAMVRRMGPPF